VPFDIVSALVELSLIVLLVLKIQYKKGVSQEAAVKAINASQHSTVSMTGVSTVSMTGVSKGDGADMRVVPNE
jgi:hypothetical protein